MKVEFSDSFFESLKRLNRYETWWYKTYDSIRYGVPRFFKNIWRFRKELYHFQDWDYSYNLSMFRRTLELTSDYMEKEGIEEETSRAKKVAKMKEAILLLKNVRNDEYIGKAEAELGPLFLRGWDFEEMDEHPGSMQLKETETEEEKLHNSKVFKRAQEIEEQQWKALWKIFEGQDMDDYKKYHESIKGTDDEYQAWSNWFDGSGMKYWWD